MIVYRFAGSGKSSNFVRGKERKCGFAIGTIDNRGLLLVHEQSPNGSSQTIGDQSFRSCHPGNSAG